MNLPVIKVLNSDLRDKDYNKILDNRAKSKSNTNIDKYMNVLSAPREIILNDSLMNKPNKTEEEAEFNKIFDSSTIINKNAYNGKEPNIEFNG